MTPSVNAALLHPPRPLKAVGARAKSGPTNPGAGTGGIDAGNPPPRHNDNLP